MTAVSVQATTQQAASRGDVQCHFLFEVDGKNYYCTTPPKETPHYHRFESKELIVEALAYSVMVKWKE